MADDTQLTDQLVDKMSLGEAVGVIRGVRDTYVAGLRLTRALQTVMDSESIVTSLETQAAEWRANIDQLKAQHDARVAELNTNYADAMAKLDAVHSEAVLNYERRLKAMTENLDTLNEKEASAKSRIESALENARQAEEEAATRIADANVRRTDAEAAYQAAHDALTTIRTQLTKATSALTG